MGDMNDTIINHDLFYGMKPGHLAILIDGAKTARFKAGELLFQEGEPANQFYLIQNGKIALETHETANHPIVLQTLGAGDVLGWSWLFPPFSWHFQARAVETANVILLNGANLLASAERDHDFGYELMKRVTQVIIRRLQATRKQLVAHQADAVPERSKLAPIIEG